MNGAIPPAGMTPRTGMPMNGTVPPAGMTPRTGMPMNGAVPPAGMTPRTAMPMNGAVPPAGMTPRTGMPMNGALPPAGMTPRTGMPMNGAIPPAGMTPRTGMPMNGAIPPAGMTPRNGMPMNNISMPNNTPYSTPMGVPLYPLYGYDNCEDMDRDMDYLKQLYPNTAKRIQGEIDNECDRLEYDGSVMFDEYPDKVSLDRIIDRVYEKVRDMDEEPQVETKSIYYTPRRRQNILRDVINIILLNEIFNRRRRYRSRRRWF
jgi:hypothetical protein